MDNVILTQDGYNKLVDELNFLKTKKRREVADQLEFARALGDLRENAEYETAKEAKQQLEIKINSLESKLSVAQIVDSSQVRKDKAFLGAKVTLENLDTGDTVQYTLVAQDEADLASGKIPVTSPVGQGILGKGPGEEAEIQVPAGKLRLKVKSIE